MKNLSDLFDRKYEEYLSKGYSESLSEACAIEFVEAYVDGYNSVVYEDLVKKMKLAGLDTELISKATGLSADVVEGIN